MVHKTDLREEVTIGASTLLDLLDRGETIVRGYEWDSEYGRIWTEVAAANQVETPDANTVMGVCRALNAYVKSVVEETATALVHAEYDTTGWGSARVAQVAAELAWDSPHPTFRPAR